MRFQTFRPTLFEFLEQLADNNNRPWFQENNDKGYLDHVVASFTASRPFMRFLCDAMKVPF
jgi:uncharacterized protein (DUF2461 family)